MSDNPNYRDLIDTSRRAFTPPIGPQGVEWPGRFPSSNEERQVFNLNEGNIPNIISSVTNGITPGHHPDAQGFLNAFAGMVQGTSPMGDTFRLGPGTLNVSNGSKSLGLDFRNRGVSLGTGGDGWNLGFSAGMGLKENPDLNAMLTFGFGNKEKTPATFLNEFFPQSLRPSISPAQEYANQTVGPSQTPLIHP